MKKYNLQTLLIGTFLTGLLLLGGCDTVPPAAPDAEVVPQNSQLPPAPIPEPVKRPPTQNDAKQQQSRATPSTPGRPSTITRRPGRSGKPAKASITQANQLMQKGRRQEAADTYYRAAFNYSSPQRERVILQAAEITASLGDQRTTRQYLNRVKQNNLNTQGQIRYRYIQSLIALLEKNPTQALALLPASTAGLPKGLSDKISLVRQRAIKMGGRTSAATTGNRNPVATSQPRIPHYNQAPRQNQTTARPGQSAANPRPQQVQRQQGTAQQPHSPAGNTGFALPRSTNRIAVLLPDTGALGKVGDEIYQGIKDAQAQYGSDTLSKRYSVNKGNALAQYRQAIEDGADIVVGPLDKGSLASLLTQPQALQVPILSLNYLNETGQLPHTLYQFGLSPEDEARQIAAFALRRGQNKGVIMTPDSAWGKRLASAFTRAYRQQGGTILNAEYYPNASPSQYLAGVNKLLSGAAGANMVFLAASPTQARLLRPILKDKAGTLPVYATSHIYSGRQDTNKNIDLDGILYTEIPLILNQDQQGLLDKLQYPRLYALGRDAVSIVKSLPQLTQRKAFVGQTGQISMSPQRRVQRQLEFATFENGRPRRLGN